ncbi:MAG: response regulator [Alphaproteobacteria bacterium]
MADAQASTAARHREVTILIVDDDDVDRKGLRRALKQMRLANPIAEAHDGLEALALLRGGDGRGPLQPPFIILLDLNMPRMNGIEFLDEIRADPALQTAVVFVLTTSMDEKDRLAAHQRNVAGYIIKSDARNSFREALSLIDHYWRVVELPGA